MIAAGAGPELGDDWLTLIQQPETRGGVHRLRKFQQDVYRRAIPMDTDRLADLKCQTMGLGRRRRARNDSRQQTPQDRFHTGLLLALRVESNR